MKKTRYTAESQILAYSPSAGIIRTGYEGQVVHHLSQPSSLSTPLFICI